MIISAPAPQSDGFAPVFPSFFACGRLHTEAATLSAAAPLG